MSGYRLRVNGRVVTSIKLRPCETAHQGWSVVIEDAEFGSFSLTREFVLEYLDLGLARELREADPARGWRRIGLGELTDVAIRIKEQAEGRRLDGST